MTKEYLECMFQDKKNLRLDITFLEANINTFEEWYPKHKRVALCGKNSIALITKAFYYFDTWFYKSSYNYESWSDKLPVFAADKFDRWWDEKQYDMIGCWSVLVQLCPEKFDIYWPALQRELLISLNDPEIHTMYGRKEGYVTIDNVIGLLSNVLPSKIDTWYSEEWCDKTKHEIIIDNLYS